MNYTAGVYCELTDRLIDKYNLHDFITLSEFRVDQRTINKIPDIKGVYFVIHPYMWPQDNFVEVGAGGFFKGKDPNVSVEILRLNWVEDADILYIGKAGGVSVNGIESNATLRERIRALLKFGNGANIGHWGGRYLWQHNESAEFKMYWYVCENENPVELEKELISQFENEYGNKPFANL